MTALETNSIDLGEIVYVPAIAHIPDGRLASHFGKRANVVLFALLIACSSAQLLFDHDISLLITLSFMTMSIALLFLFETDAFQFRSWIILAFLFNLLVPKISLVAQIIDIMHSFLSYAIEFSLSLYLLETP